MELPAPVSGVIAKVLKHNGETAAVGEVIGYMEETGADGDKAAAAAAQAQAAETIQRAPRRFRTATKGRPSRVARVIRAGRRRRSRPNPRRRRRKHGRLRPPKPANRPWSSARTFLDRRIAASGMVAAGARFRPRHLASAPGGPRGRGGAHEPDPPPHRRSGWSKPSTPRRC